MVRTVYPDIDPSQGPERIVTEKTHTADPANAWCMAGFFTFMFGAVVAATVSVTSVGLARDGGRVMGLSSSTAAIVMGAAACFCGWLALKTILGAVRGMPRVTISDRGVMVEGAIGGRRWAEWSSLSGFAVSFLGQKRVPVAVARITGDGVSRNLRGKMEFAVGGALTIAIAALTEELNAGRPPSAGPAAAPPPENPQARLAAERPSGLSIPAIVLIWCALLGQSVWLYFALFRD